MNQAQVGPEHMLEMIIKDSLQNVTNPHKSKTSAHADTVAQYITSTTSSCEVIM